MAKPTWPTATSSGPTSRACGRLPSWSWCCSTPDRPVLRRLRRRRRVLRALRVSDHAVAAARGRRNGHDLVAPFLGAAGATAAPGVVRGGRRHRHRRASAVGTDRPATAGHRRRRGRRLRRSTSSSPAAWATTSHPNSARRPHRCCTSGRWRWRSSSTCSGRSRCLRSTRRPRRYRRLVTVMMIVVAVLSFVHLSVDDPHPPDGRVLSASGAHVGARRRRALAVGGHVGAGVAELRGPWPGGSASPAWRPRS